MKLSVIIPCFNAAKTIAVQLEALANQEWSEPWEVIISNNGSTDESMAIVEQYRERLPHLRMVDASDKRGASHARNVGAAVATGEALAFCDADDEVAPGWVAGMGEALSKHDFVAARLEYRKLNEAWLVEGENKQQETGLIKHDEKPPNLPYAAGCSLGMKRSIYEAVGKWNEFLLYTEDIEYCWRVQLAGTELHFVPNAVVHYRLRDNLIDIYRQGHNWAQFYIPLRKKYGEKRSRFTSLKKIVKIGLHMQMVFLRIHRKAALAGWLWNLGWKIGELKGVVKDLTLDKKD